MGRFSKVFQMVGVLALVCLNSAIPSRADVRYGDFESDDFGTAWTVLPNNPVTGEDLVDFGRPDHGGNGARSAIFSESDSGSWWRDLDGWHYSDTDTDPPPFYSHAILQQDSVILEEGQTLAFDLWLEALANWEYAEEGDETDWLEVVMNDIIRDDTRGTHGWGLPASEDDTRFFHERVMITGLSPGAYSLKFRFVGEYDGWNTTAVVDNVAVVPVPLPGAVVLGSLGLGAAGWLCRRMRV